MKITIDKDSGTVTIHGSCKIGELIEFLSKFYSGATWEDLTVMGEMLQGYAITTSSPHTQPFNTPLYRGIPLPGTYTYDSGTQLLTDSDGNNTTFKII